MSTLAARRDRVLHVARTSWVDIAWVVFILLNLLAMRLFGEWQTVPFLIIWVSATVIYGFRLWRLGSTLVTVGTLTLATGVLIGWQVVRHKQDVDYLAEVPLIAMMFVVMVWHSRRRAATMAEINRVSEHNLRLLDQQRQFLQDASHELRTPITIALCHAELIERAAAGLPDQAIARDARVAVDELLRLRRLTSRLLLLAATDGPDFLRPGPVDVAELMLETLHRWRNTPRRWSLGAVAEVQLRGDADRLMLALDALIENAVDHTGADDQIELSARREDGGVILAVTDSGSGIPAAAIGQIFGRFARVDAGRSRTDGGFGLGLALVKAIAEAHQGSVRVRSTPGEGSVFEVCLPEPAAGTAAPGVAGPAERLGQRAIS
ncbi:MAG TPA: HAMP domain-containing sensor histidine kinase [Streptosporangiaceae bacterium]|nr:HAMP domain-containing sensor histidine kinase [Streptosporangiaceae bacterium]